MITRENRSKDTDTGCTTRTIKNIGYQILPISFPTYALLTSLDTKTKSDLVCDITPNERKGKLTIKRKDHARLSEDFWCIHTHTRTHNYSTATFDHVTEPNP